MDVCIYGKGGHIEREGHHASGRLRTHTGRNQIIETLTGASAGETIGLTLPKSFSVCQGALYLLGLLPLRLPSLTLLQEAGSASTTVSQGKVSLGPEKPSLRVSFVAGENSGDEYINRVVSLGLEESGMSCGIMLLEQ